MASNGFTHESTVNESIEWYTPPEVFEALGLTFDLDPCSPGPGNSFVPTRKHYTIVDDGLTSPWEGTVWVNPPYGPHTPVWLNKLAEHGDGIALVFSRTDTRWFQEAAATAGALCFISSRVRFFKGSTTERGGSPGAGSVLIAYGEKAVEALKASGLGVVVEVAATRPALSLVAA
ncbi:DNA N-6-adenine-methyltransferase [Pseudactinotalea terrae]|uniref:DNA N-6-adenine-methyltransferase n=1 Tax=Pseudactinotalea terrae TaxID=1743262 RepID=UPI0012E2DA0A|nr:DNA N-6-adenine-methyltransferase [Pseudactinotalea terrae]